MVVSKNDEYTVYCDKFSNRRRQHGITTEGSSAHKSHFFLLEREWKERQRDSNSLTSIWIVSHLRQTLLVSFAYLILN